MSRTRSGLRGLCPGPATIEARSDAGGSDRALKLEVTDRWIACPSRAELDLLDLAIGPVLDIGCGPGRHLLALARLGVDALGIDVSPHVVALARHRGAAVLEGSIFGPIPDTGKWGSCLLLDGNIGIGAHPETLLARARELLRPEGRILVEAAQPGAGPNPRKLRLSVHGKPGPSFSWTDVSIDSLPRLADVVGLTLTRTWHAERRWFAWLTSSHVVTP